MMTNETDFTPISTADWERMKAEVFAEAIYKAKRISSGMPPELWEAMGRDTLVADAYARLVDQFATGG